ncbi:hypothetical protein Q5P01_003208 [Channa striata]|uniref:Uncharacterized protein n=1 Tax=Channa striata TaxID=64152 RepID=A0AA88NFI5_CHASR|nr:hypothetical protein Q5P01_003208 [Channa striata]
MFYLKLQVQHLLPVLTIQTVGEAIQNVHEMGQDYTSIKLRSLLKHDMGLTDDAFIDCVKDLDHQGQQKTYPRAQKFKDVQIYGNRTQKYAYCLPVREVLKYFANNGIIKGDETIKGALYYIAGDNLGSHSVGGFTETFSNSQYFCRYFCQPGLPSYALYLWYFIKNKKWLTYSLLNQRMKNLKYKGSKALTKPCAINSEAPTLSGQTVQNWNLLRLLSVLLGDKVQNREKYYDCQLMLYLKTLCARHLKNVKTFCSTSSERHQLLKACLVPGQRCSQLLQVNDCYIYSICFTPTSTGMQLKKSLTVLVFPFEAEIIHWSEAAQPHTHQVRSEHAIFHADPCSPLFQTTNFNVVVDYFIFEPFRMDIKMSD